MSAFVNDTRAFGTTRRLNEEQEHIARISREMPEGSENEYMQPETLRFSDYASASKGDPAEIDRILAERGLQMQKGMDVCGPQPKHTLRTGWDHEAMRD